MSLQFPLNSLSIASALTLLREISKLSGVVVEKAEMSKDAYGFLLQLISTEYSPSPRFLLTLSLTSLLGSKFSAYLMISLDFHLCLIDFDLSSPAGFLPSSKVQSCIREEVFSSLVRRPRQEAEMSLQFVQYFSCQSVIFAQILFLTSSSLSQTSLL